MRYNLSIAVSLAAGLASAHATTERPVHRYLEIAISPDARLIASVEGDAPLTGNSPVVRDLVIRHANGSGAATIALPCGRVPQCWPGSPAWMPDGAHLAFTLRQPGSHARSIYQVDARGQGMAKLLDFNGTIETLRYGPDGRLAMLATAGATKEVGATQAGAPDTGDLGGPVPEQRIAILNAGKLSWASPPDLFVYEYDWRPDGSGFAGTAAPGDGDDNWWVAKLYRFDAATGQATVIFSPPNERVQIAQPKVSRDGRRVAFIGGLMSDFVSTGGDIYSVSINGGPALDLTPAMKGSADELGWGCDGSLNASLVRDDQEQFAAFGAGNAVVQPRVVWSGAESFSGNDTDLALACPSAISAVAHETFTRPPEIEVGRVGAWHDITALNRGTDLALKVKSIHWRSGGFAEQGWLVMPARARGKLPMITMVHGGPGAASGPGYAGPGLNRALYDRGYALFRPNPRGSFGQGEAFTNADVRDWGTDHSPIFWPASTPPNARRRSMMKGSASAAAATAATWRCGR